MKKYKIQLILLLALLGAMAGGLFAVLTVEKSWDYFLFGASDGAWIGAAMAAYTLLVVRGDWGRGMRKHGFLFKVFLNSFVYVVIFFVGRQIGHSILGRSYQLIWDKQFIASLVFSVVLALLVNFILEMSQLVGSKAVWNFVRGIYHRPIEEDRVFLFVDLAGSTTIAEEIGNRKFLDLLNLFFSALSLAASETDAEIYKYVGDEAIITWRAGDAATRDNALDCFFKFQRYLKLDDQVFKDTFGLVPTFRGAIHRGWVVAGELGVLRKEIAYLGDVVNTTARLMETAREHAVPLVVSDSFLSLYNGKTPSRFKLKLIGDETLRGKDEKITVYSVEG